MAEKKTGSRQGDVEEVRDEETFEEEPIQQISLFLAIGLIVGALVIGLVIGYAVAPKSGGGSSDFTGTSGTQAPALSQDQLKGGQLPAGHPTVPGGGPTGSTETPAATGSAPGDNGGLPVK